MSELERQAVVYRIWYSDGVRWAVRPRWRVILEGSHRVLNIWWVRS